MNPVFLCLLFASALFAAPPPGARWQLAFSDEFEGAALDTSEWQCRTGPRVWSEQRPENVSGSGGMLRLALRKEKAGDLDHTAGGVISREAFQHGYHEPRLKMPRGRGWHTSFWMMQYGPKSGLDDRYQEIDVCEQDSSNARAYSVNWHSYKPHVSLGPRPIETPDLAAGFHVFGAEFGPREVRVPAELRGEVNGWGLCRDEYPNTGHWPVQLHIRESRRMIGRHGMTEHDILTRKTKEDPVAMGNFVLDSHWVQRFADPAGFVRVEGHLDESISLSRAPYETPYRSITPRAEECSNLLVPVCVSATHVAICTIRMEPVYIMWFSLAAV